MTANLFGSRFVGIRQPAWHGLGKVLDNPVPATQAVREADMDFSIIKSPMYASIQDGTGVVKVNTDKVGIFRTPTPDDPTYRFFGTASDDYAIMQNMEIAEVVEPLTKLWPVETIGALGKGETIFMALDAGDAEVHGEAMKQYFLLTDTRNGGTSMKIAFTPVRVVCQNTLVSGLRSSIVSSALTHTPNVAKQLSARVDLLQKMQQALSSTMATFEQLASAAITENDAKAIFEAAYPMPSRSKKIDLLDGFDNTTGPEMLGALYDEATIAQETWLYYCGRVEAFRDGAMANYQRLCDEHTGVAGTAWAAYNAVVEFADFRFGSNSVQESALFGARAAEKKRAFAQSLEFIR